MGENNKLVQDDEALPTPQERADLALEQEQVEEMIVNCVTELNTYLAHASQIGMFVNLREEHMDEVGKSVPRKMITVANSTGLIGYRRPVKHGE